MKKTKKSSWKQLLLYLVWFIVGILLGYYLGYDLGFEKNSSATPQPTITITCNALTNISPQAGDKVASPLTVTITVDNRQSCKWTVFEAQAGTFTLKDTTGQTIGSGTLTTTEDWMTENPVVYTGTTEFINTPASSELTLTITEEDPSGMGAQEITIPLSY